MRSSTFRERYTRKKGDSWTERYPKKTGLRPRGRETKKKSFQFSFEGEKGGTAKRKGGRGQE